MPRALEVLDVACAASSVARSAQSRPSTLLTERLTIRENRRVQIMIQNGQAVGDETNRGFDFAFQPSLVGTVLALAGYSSSTALKPSI